MTPNGQSERQKRVLSIDKRFIAINFDEIALIESALFKPTPANLRALKARFQLPLNFQEISEQWHNPNSILRKWFTTLLKSELSRCLFIEHEIFNNLMAVWSKHEKIKNLVELVEHRINQLRVKRILAPREKIENLHKLLAEVITKQPLTLSQLTPLSHSMLEAARSGELKYYLSYIHSESEARAMYKALERRYLQAESNLVRLEALMSSVDISPEQREEAEEIYARHSARFSPESLEITRRQHAGIDLKDPVQRAQYLNIGIVREEIIGKSIDKVQKALAVIEVSQENIIKMSQVKSLKHEQKPSLESVQKSWKLRILQDTLSDALGEITEKKEIILHGVLDILELQAAIQSAIKAPNKNNLAVVNDKATSVKGLLSQDGNYSRIVTILQSCIIQSADQPEPVKLSETEILANIKSIYEDEDTPKEIKPYIQEFYQLLGSDLQKGQGEGITDAFNQLVIDFPNAECLQKVREAIEVVPFVDESRLKQVGPRSIDFR